MLFPLLLAGALLAPPSVPAPPPPQGDEVPAEDAPPLKLRVNRAIARGVQELKRAQGADGRWLHDENRYPGGLTALGAYTLVKSGVRRNDSELGAALRALAEIEPESTYGTSVRLLLYEALGEPEAWRSRAERCRDLLVGWQRQGLWGYPDDPIDMSNVQFALLGLRAAHAMGLAVPDDTLEDCARAIWSYQDDTGGFRYRGDSLATAGITAATLGGIEILRELSAERPRLSALLRKKRREIAAAEEWLEASWSPARNAYGRRAWTPGWHHPYLWAVERWCELTGREELGGRDWYREGAEWLVGSQKESGAFGDRVFDTCFALLFLRRTTFSGGPELAEIYEEIDRLAARADEPTLQPGARRLVDWLAAGPFQGKPEETGLADPPFDPSRVRVRERTRVARQRWERIRLKDDGWTNLEDLLQPGCDACVWVLGTRFVYPPGGAPKGVELAPLRAALWFSLEDGWRVFLDGEELASSRRIQAPIRPDVRVPIELEPGEHELVLLLEDAKGAAAFEAFLTDPAGFPLLAAVADGPDG